MKAKWECFGNFRENYGFVTYKNRSDAYRALEHANDDKSHPPYQLSFGGRRQFCQNEYADLGKAVTYNIYSFKFVIICYSFVR